MIHGVDSGRKGIQVELLYKKNIRKNSKISAKLCVFEKKTAVRSIEQTDC